MPNSCPKCNSKIVVKSGIIKTITGYRKFAKENPDLKYSTVPEKSYKNYGWSGWRKYSL